MAAPSSSDPIAAATEAALDMDAPLAARLKIVADEVARLNPSFAEIVDRLVARLADNGVGLAAPKPGEPMPEFILPDETGRLVSLSQILASGPAVISFHRGHWCPYCQLNIDALAKASPRAADLGAEIVAITPETQAWSREFKRTAQAPFRILSDIDGAYALELNLLFWIGDEKREAMKSFGVDLALYQGNETWMLPVPATFVVRRDGLVAARFIDPDYRRRTEMEDLLAALRLAR